MGMLAMQIAATGMQSNQTKVDVISGNLANMNTTGYKESMASFEDLMYIDYAAGGSSTSDAGTVRPSAKQVTLGSGVSGITKKFEQGAAVPTPGNDKNLMINGIGFFQVALPNGTTAYTRDGELAVSSTGELVTKLGYAIQPAMTVPEGVTITVSNSGAVSYVDADGITQNLGTLELAKFNNPSGLTAIGGNMYIENPDASGTAVTGAPNSTGFGVIQQYNLEASNVDSISSIVNLLTAQRGYEYCSKVITAGEQMAENNARILNG